MKIERINDFQIRCTLTNFDLSIRNLHVNDLAYGSEKTGDLFHEMMHRASTEVGFEAEDTPLMVEAIPMANESIMLIITKLDDPEELDTRFSKFSPADEDDEASWMSFPAETLDGAEELRKLIGPQGAINLPELLSELGDCESDKFQRKDFPAPAAAEDSDSPSNDLQFMRIYLFDTLDLVCAAAKQTGNLFNGSSVLYKNPATGMFYLILKKEDSDDQAFHRTCNILSEYAALQKYDPAMEAYFSEHYELFVRKDALKSLALI